MRPEAEDIERGQLLEAIYRRYHYDFRRYAIASLRRRLSLAMPALGVGTLPALQERVLSDPTAFAQLLSFLTVQVSDLFRDPPYWHAVRTHVVPFLQTFPYFRIWVAGCSSGEEVHSFAILLKEAGLLDRALIYATDIDPTALERARNGVYDAGRIPDSSVAYRAAGGSGSLADYYTAAYGRAAFDETLRRHVVFSDHSLTTDGAFAEMQMVSCRNVMIYFDRGLQERAIGLFHESLGHHGYLGLGMRETLRFTSHAASFESVAAAERIWRKS